MNWLNKKFLSFLSLKKKTIFSVLFFTLWGILFPGKNAYAAWYDFVISAVTFIPMVAISIILLVGVLLTGLLAAFSGEVLTWVTGPNFIATSTAAVTWSYTRNPIVDIGLNITQPFVNMILVLVLVFIALATILRFENYEVKKLLPTFVLVALLVNFSPVICGLIVDASNILMNFFLSEITGGKRLISLLDSVGDTVVGMVGNWATFRADQNIPLLLMMAVTIVVNLGLFLILLLFAFIFMARYLAIWILVILSPLAFACYILPATRGVFTKWWSQFIQWSVIGITMGFFLYLADQFATLNPTVAVSAAGLGGAVLPALVPLVFLWLGFTFGLATGAIGGQQVMKFTRGTGKWLGSKGWTGAKSWAEEKGRTREAAGKAVQTLERVPGVRAFIPQKAREYGQFRPAIDAEQKKAAFQSSPELAHRMATGADYGVKAVANMMEIVDRGDSQDIFNTFKKKYNVEKDEDLYKIPEFQNKMSRWLQIALKGGRHNNILRSAPRLARFAPGANIPGYGGISGDEAVSKAVSEARGQHIKNWEREELQDEAVINAGLARGRDFWQSVSGQVKKGHEEPLQTMANIFKRDYYKEGMSEAEINNAWDKFHTDTKLKNNGQDGFFQFLESSRAREQGWTPERIKELATGQKITPQAPPATPGAAAGLTSPSRGKEAAETRPIGGPGVRARAGRPKGETITAPTPPSGPTPGEAAGIKVTAQKKPPRGRGGVGT